MKKKNTYYWKHREKELRYHKKHRVRYRLAFRIWHLLHKKEYQKYGKAYRAKNKNRLCKYYKKWRKKRYNADYCFRLITRHRSKIRHYIKKRGVPNREKLIPFLGCTPRKLIIYIESLWAPGMTWKNRGKTGWQLDHIRPLTSFNLKRLKQQKAAFHYSNLQPIWTSKHLLKTQKERVQKDKNSTY